jgi:phosphatidylglycerophosphate synthase
MQQVLQDTQPERSAASQALRLTLERLAADPHAATIDVRQHVWVPLTPPFAASAAAAEQRLLRTLGRDGDSPLVRQVARAVSRSVTKWLLHTRITPNQITLVSATIGLCGAVFLAQPATLLRVLGACLFLLSTIVDGCDGELARLTFRESAFGAKLDVTMDNVVHVFLFCAIALGQYRQHQDSLYLILGAFTLGGVFLSMAVYLPYVLRPRPVSSRQARLHECLASRDFAYLLPILAALNLLHWFLWATVIGTYLFALAWVVITWRQRRHQPG